VQQLFLISDWVADMEPAGDYNQFEFRRGFRHCGTPFLRDCCRPSRADGLSGRSASCDRLIRGCSIPAALLAKMHIETNALVFSVSSRRSLERLDVRSSGRIVKAIAEAKGLDPTRTRIHFQTFHLTTSAHCFTNISFTTATEKRTTGHWWRRQLKGIYISPSALRQQ